MIKKTKEKSKGISPVTLRTLFIGQMGKCFICNFWELIKNKEKCLKSDKLKTVEENSGRKTKK